MLSFDVEEIISIDYFIEKLQNKDLAKKVKAYFQSDKNILQDIFNRVNSFQKQIYIILRIYRNAPTNTHLALWIELQNNEVENIKPELIKISSQKEKITKTKNTNTDKLLIDIQSYAKRYEISSQLLNFINKKINNKTENITLIREIYGEFKL